MTKSFSTLDDALAALPIPLPGIGIQFRTTADELAKLTEDALEVERSWGIACNSKEVITEFAVAQLGSVAVTAGRTKPVALQYRNGNRITIEMCYGGRSRFNEGITNIETNAGEVIAFPNTGGILCGSDHSGISFCLDRKRLERTVQSIYGKEFSAELDRPLAIQEGKNAKGGTGSGPLFLLFKMINSLLVEDPFITEAMNIDDQIYRASAITLAQSAAGVKIKLIRRNGVGKYGFDSLIDYIRSKAHQNLTLTDLEEQSHYSARHLQNLFHEKFDCTPMQFVRRQRLSSAMEKLQQGSWHDSVTSIARECGYRFTSNFSSDFHREFGVAPSVVLRASRTPGHKV